MEDKINDFLDSITEQELQELQQIEIIDMEDDIAKKRIQKMVKKKISKKYKKTAIVAACFVALAIFTVEPVRAELEKILHFVPNIGIVESDVVYEAEVLCGELQKENVTVELKDCYVKYGYLYGTILITDTSPYNNDIETDDDITEQDNMMKEMYQKYSVTLHHAQQQHILNFTRSGYNIGQNKRQVRKNLQVMLDKSDENKYYEIEIAGFEQKLSFCLKEAKQISDLKQIGSTVTQNGSSITATAEMTKQGAKITYYAICSEEAKTINQFGEQSEFWRIMPYFESIPDAIYECYLKTKSGNILYPIGRKPLKESGGEAIFDVTKKDFPATFYYTSLCAKTDECYFFDMPIPEIDQTIQTDIDVAFQYGTIKILSVSRTKSMEQTGNVIKDEQTGNTIQEKKEMDTLAINVHIEPNQKQRILYHFNADVPLMHRRSRSIDIEENDIFTQTLQITIDKIDKQETVKMKFYEPTYWIVGEYEIPVDLN